MKQQIKRWQIKGEDFGIQESWSFRSARLFHCYPSNFTTISVLTLFGGFSFFFLTGCNFSFSWFRFILRNCSWILEFHIKLVLSLFLWLLKNQRQWEIFNCWKSHPTYLKKRKVTFSFPVGFPPYVPHQHSQTELCKKWTKTKKIE